MPTQSDIGARLKQIRSAFNDSFALPSDTQAESQIHILIAEAAGVRFGFRMEQLAGLQRLEILTPLPGRIQSLLGITAVEGELVAVFDMAVLLGLDGQRGHRQWLATVEDGGRRFGLAFNTLIGTRLVKPSDFRSAESPRPGGLASEAIQEKSGLIQIINLAAVRTAVKDKTEAD